MAARATLAELVTEVRRMVGDKTEPYTFDDDDIRAALDARRDDVSMMELRPAATIAPGGAVVYLDYFAPYGAWEQGETLQGPGFAVLTPLTAERMIGVWHFAENQYAPVFLTGRAYDLAAVAADLLEVKLQRIGDGFDFSVDGLSVNRGGQSAALQQSIAKFRGRQRVQTIKMMRGDE